jgi:ATP-binding cassette subfamily B protein
MKRQVLLYVTIFTVAKLFLTLPLYATDKNITSQITTEQSGQDEFFDIKIDMMCGPNCLWQISRAFGKMYSLGSIGNMAGTNLQNGTPVKGMVDAARKMGLQAQAVKVNIKTLSRDSRIAILLLNLREGNHYAILDKIENNKVRLLDSDKFRTLSIRELQSIWKGYAILIGDQENHRKDRFQRYFGRGLQISGLLILLVVVTYGVKSTYIYLSKRQ